MQDLIDALLYLSELEEEDLLEELLPELAELCKHTWLMKLLIAYCERRGH